MKKTFLLLLALLIILTITILLLQTDWTEPSRRSLDGFFRTRTKIAVLEINGPIYNSQQYIDELEELVENPWVAGVILRLNCPGGAVASSQELFSTVKKYREKKPIITSIENVGTSGAYYVALASDKIYANPGSVTGSIGVIMEFYNTADLWDKIGISFRVIKSGDYKDIGSPVREMTPEEQELLQTSTDNVYKQFLDVVKQERGEILLRNMPSDTENTDLDEYVYQIADGRVYTGQQAYNLGLVDELGGLYDAADYLQAKLDLPEKHDFVRPRRKRFPFLGFMTEISQVLELHSHSGAKILYMCPVSR